MDQGSQPCGLRRRLVGIIAASALVAAASALALAPAAEGDSLSSLQARVGQAKAQAQSLATGVQIRTAELQAAAGDAAAAGSRQRALEAGLVQSRARLERLTGAVVVEQGRLVVAQARFRRSQNQLARRLVAIYKSDTPDIATVLLEADGFRDLLTRTEYLKQINDADSALVRRVQSLRDSVQALLGRLRELHGLAEGEVARMQVARDQVAQIRAAAEARAATLARARATQQAALAALQSRVSGWSGQVRALQQAGGGGPGTPGQTVGQWIGSFSIPKSVVMCESGGNYNAVNPKSGAGGAYQMLPTTYKGLGGRYKAPQLAPKWEQDRLAAKLWAGGQGSGNWACAH